MRGGVPISRGVTARELTREPLRGLLRALFSSRHRAESVTAAPASTSVSMVPPVCMLAGSNVALVGTTLQVPDIKIFRTLDARGE